MELNIIDLKNEMTGINNGFGLGKNSGNGCSINYLREQKKLKDFIKKNNLENEYEIKKIREINEKNEYIEYSFSKTGRFGKYELQKNKVDVLFSTKIWHHVQNKKNNSWNNVLLVLTKKGA